MINYWNELKLTQKQNKKERFNYILNYLHSKIDSNNSTGTGSSDESDDDGTVKTTSVAVRILNMDDEPIQGASVVLSDGTNTYSCTTGSAGGCTLSDVILGEYETSVEATDYITAIDTFTVVEGENTFEVVLDDENNK